ncbi:hypothetical protein H257_14881 [Aphanomyces astaci]|uniref:DDE Tnp4 domain-containing protein n=1 Tax=Aphanomyces astaci TaxID=112090 RepID=W4FRR0_APHAT|nr:hypothetical protein H257_14881 [Aphanomyces astaci]ETV69519.1 hypothetical protein H257_14881 [Aphanomyces astaci]|eukprot:XP_009841092.1 hypothetical protein H257_14881 [Aphanomyces astaci]
MSTAESDLALRVYKWAKRKKLNLATTTMLLEFGLGLPVERPLIPVVSFEELTTGIKGRDMRDADAVLSFRFDVSGVLELTSLLGVPNVVITSSRDRVTGVEAMAILLKRLRYPITFYDMLSTFGRSREQLCRIFNHMIQFVYTTWRDHIYCNKRIVRARIAQYARVIQAKGSPLSNVWAFPDGTKIETCRISASANGAVGLNLQKRTYSGHKRMHCLNFQGLTTPDGLCIHFFGPLEGSRHDVTVLRISQLQEYFEANSNIFNGYYIYGDPAYPISKWIVSSYKGNNLDEQRQRFNTAMSRVRQGVEWNFGRMKNLWGFTTYKMQQKIMLSNVGAVVLVAMFMTNCNCCYHGGNQISSYFGMDPPTLKEYLTSEFSDIV